MKIKKYIQYFSVSLIILGIIGALGMVIWSATSTYPAREMASEYLESTEIVTITHDEWIVFTPNSETNIGIIFYPGGLVEAEAYSPILHKVAEKGVQIVITRMPLNLAIFDTGVATDVIDAYPEIEIWYIAGHSLGGAAAGIYIENNSDRLEGAIFWDSYPPESSDLSDNQIRVLSIYGMTDEFPNTDGFNEKRSLLPPDTYFIGIEGASHAQFGDYGPQKGDVTPSISMEEQHQYVYEQMMDFIFQDKN